jgi:hypothetical protein
MRRTQPNSLRMNEDPDHAYKEKKHAYEPLAAQIDRIARPMWYPARCALTGG